MKISLENIVYFVIAVGAILRLTLWHYSPPNNSYDNHLEAIAFYLNNHTRPFPGNCWECYQPPLYYIFSSFFFKMSHIISDNYYTSWKVVQLVNVVLSIFNLLLIRNILKRFNFGKYIVIPLSIIAIYPRDIYASVMITNDYMLVFFATLSFLYYLKYLEKKNLPNLITCLIFVVLSALTKQHGLILIIIPIYVMGKSLVKERLSLLKTKEFFFLIFSILLVVSDEIWKFFQTGKFLVSNQDFYNFTSTQQPGSLDRVDFFSFDFLLLLKNPFLAEQTLFSFWTQLFARSWFDYEWRFLSPGLEYIKLLSNTMYICGALITAILLFRFWVLRKALIRIRNDYWMLIIISFLFLAVPIVQTFRFPFYSSMKSQFFLPAISIFALGILFCFRFKTIKEPTIKAIVLFTLGVGVFHILFVSFNIDESLPNLSGPLWDFPTIF